MREVKFRVWHRKEKKMYYRGYLKFLTVLLCEDDQGKHQGAGIPTKKASYEDCVMLEATNVFDIHDNEIYEGDRVRVYDGDHQLEGVVGGVPDMFRSRGLHPMNSLLEELGVVAKVETLQFEILGHVYE